MKVTNPSRIARRRKRLGYTQADLAALVGCTQQYVSAIERGLDTDCSVQIAEKIAKRLDIDVEDVFEERGAFGMQGDASHTLGRLDRTVA